jgi:hypothetical protein
MIHTFAFYVNLDDMDLPSFEWLQVIYHRRMKDPFEGGFVNNPSFFVLLPQSIAFDNDLSGS